MSAGAETKAERRIVVHEGMAAVEAALGDELATLVGDERAAQWRLPRGGYAPTLWVDVVDGAPRAAVLTTGRPATAATTLVDPWWADEGALQRLVASITDDARARGTVALKWRGETVPPVLDGFVSLRAPFGAVGTERVRGAVRWLSAIPHAEPGYYAQTTLFTCAAVAALMGAGVRGVGGFAADGADRDRELDYWRRATNFPACEPIGLGVATAEHLGAGAVEIALDTAGPVLLEEYEGFDRSFRAELQAESVRRAEELGVRLDRRRVDVAEIARRVAGGELALLLIDEEPMHAVHGPHWVLAHASDGHDVVVIEDPWVNRESGETWVDVHELPIRLADLDRLVRWSDEDYRGVVFVGE